MTLTVTDEMVERAAEKLCSIVFGPNVTPTDDTRNAVRAALEAALSAAPQGVPHYDASKWQLVPKEPSEEMIEAGDDAMDWDSSDTNGSYYVHYREGDAAKSWTAMLSASPTPPVSHAEGRNTEAETKAFNLHRALTILLDIYKHPIRDTDSFPTFGNAPGIDETERVLFDNRPRAEWERPDPAPAAESAKPTIMQSYDATLRAQVIEECAEVADREFGAGLGKVATAIRALSTPAQPEEGK